MVVDIRHENVEYHPSIEGCSVRLCVGAVARQSIHKLRIASALTVSRTGDRHCREKRDPDLLAPIEPPGEENRLFRNSDSFVVGRGDSGAIGQSKRNLFPGFDAVVVGFLRELGDGEMTMLV